MEKNYHMKDARIWLQLFKIRTIGVLLKTCTLLKERKFKFQLTSMILNKLHLSNMKFNCWWKEMEKSCIIASIKSKLWSLIVANIHSWFWMTWRMVCIIWGTTSVLAKSMILKSPLSKANTGTETTSWNKMRYAKAQPNKASYWSMMSTSEKLLKT